jgi:transposase
MAAAHSTEYLQAENGRLQMENTLLREMLRRLRLEKYGRASEKLTDAQLELLEQEPGVQAPEVTQEAELPPEKKPAVAVPAQRRPHPGRAELPAHLPRVIVDLPCAPEQCRCGQCGQPTEVIGYDEREELEVKPAEYFVRVIRREKRACKAHPEAGVAMPVAAPRIREKGKLSDQFIIDLLVRKYQWHQPLYRQAAMLEQEHGLGLSRQSLGDAVLWVGSLLEPVRQALRLELLAGQYIQADETPVDVQTERVRGKNFEAYLFEYSRPQGPVVFDFRMGRGREGPEKFLAGYSGILQCDGYAGYDKVGAQGLRRAGCMAHMRRRFWQARELDQNDGDLLAVLAMVGDLYAVEEQARQQTLDAAGRRELRRGKSVALMDKLKTKIIEIRQRVLPRSTAGDACNYALNQWSRLIAFLEEGQIEIDNNWCENGIRPVALGRKNWLHIGSERAGPRVAAIMSILETCRRLKLDVRAYLRDVLPKLPGWLIHRVAELTPTAWQTRPPQ